MLQIRLHRDPTITPLHRQIVDQLGYQIDKGEIPPGMRLPPTRDLARELGVSRGTVVLAYEELCALGKCESRVGRGTSVKDSMKRYASEGSHRAFVARDETLTTPDEPVNLDPRDISLLPSLADTEHLPVTDLRRAFDRVLRSRGHLKSFSESAGDPFLRHMICEKILPDRGINADASEVMVVPGTQYGAVLVALALSGVRKRIHFGSPGYLDFARNFARFGFEMVPHSVDQNGIALPDIDLGPDDVLYVMPEHHFPQCVTLSDARRRSFERMAIENNLLILEDDYDSEYYYERRPQAAMRAGDSRQSIIYFGTFSKTLFNNIRLGYIVADANLIRELATMHWSLSRGTSGIVQRWVAELIKDDVISRHVQRMRNIYRQKRDRVAEALRCDFPDWSFEPPKGGLQFCVDVGSAKHAETILTACRRHKLKISSPENYGLTDSAEGQRFIVIGFGAAPVSQILDALQHLKQAFTPASAP